MHLSHLRERLGSTLWFVPALFVLAAAGAAVALANVDPSIAEGVPLIGFAGEADAARSLLSTVAGAMITFTGLVFSITILVLQLAGQQYSPRALRTFLRDRPSQVALGTFVATFTYALVVLRAVTTESVPSLAVSVAVLLVLTSVGVFVAYIDHIAQSIRVTAVLERIVSETETTIDRQYPRDADAASGGDLPVGDPLVLGAPRSAVVTGFDEDALVSFARKRDGVIRLLASVGDHVPQGAPLIEVRTRARIEDADVGPLFDAMTFGEERTATQDIAFGLRQLVDIAQRALSPGVNDPTTAVQSIDRIHALLRRLADRPMPLAFRDDEGIVRLVRRGPTWSGLLSMTCSEIRLYALGAPAVLARIRSMLLDLLNVTPPERRVAIARELHLLGPIDAAVMSRGSPAGPGGASG